MAIKVGILAEERNDVEVVECLIQKFIPRKKFSIQSFVGHGCGKLRSKCRDWAQQLSLRGCSLLILFHDLDERQLPQLQSELNRTLTPCPIGKHAIIIPVREIEAWLLCDARALKEAFGLSKTPNLPSQPEHVLRPKEKLKELIWHYSEKRTHYLNSVHNKKIAEHVQVKLLTKCSAFKKFQHFVKDKLC